MNDLQALVTGALIGAMMQAPGNGLAVDVEPETDDAGNYLPAFIVTGRESLTRVRVTIELEEGSP